MAKQMSTKRLAWLVCAVAPAVAFAACVGDSPVLPGPDAGAPDSTADADEPFEAGVEKEGGLILDGGGNPDDSDSGVVIDAGKDAGTCGPPSGTPPVISSTCAFLSSSPGGGSLATVSYRLTGYIVYGSPSYCSGTFKSVDYSGKLVITKNSNGSYNFSERVAAKGTIYFPPNTPNKNFTVIPNGGTDLTVTQTCGNVVTDTSWPYTSAGTIGARTITYARTSGTAAIKLSWTQE